MKMLIDRDRMKEKIMEDNIKGVEEAVTGGSGNVFEDLGLVNPYYIQLKADLIMAIQDIIKANGLEAKHLEVSKLQYNRIISHKSRDHDMLGISPLMQILDDQGYKAVVTISKK